MHLTRQPLPRVPRSVESMAKRDLHLPQVMYVSGRGRDLVEEETS